MTDNDDPDEIRLAKGGRALEIAWNGGDRASIPAARLRAASRSAGAVRAKADGRTAHAADVAITDVEIVGSYAVRLFFSDGHDRGIYPWRYLRELAAA